MDFRNVQTFLRVAEIKSFTKAARELNYAQSTVTMQIQQLEKELGYQLFDRIGKTVSLTPMGQAFLHHAYALQRTVDMAMTLDKSPDRLRGTLRVGVLESLLFGTMLEVLPVFREQYPNVDLQLRMGQTTELVQQLKGNSLDMVYLSADQNTDPDLRSCYLRREQLVFVCGNTHPAAGAKTMEELLEYDFVVTERTGICYGRLLDLAAAHGKTLRGSIEVDSTIAIADAAIHGLGVAFLPRYAVRHHLEKGTLTEVTVGQGQEYYSQILCHKNHWISPFMEGMIRIITEKRPPQE
ncbi:MAG: LysR family transcriptional regulator [Oscillospiraceae bacterium]|nr:LysR family transcriptional regulator [Oscillospiraceae bacterium]